MDPFVLQNLYTTYRDLLIYQSLHVGASLYSLSRYLPRSYSIKYCKWDYLSRDVFEPFSLQDEHDESESVSEFVSGTSVASKTSADTAVQTDTAAQIGTTLQVDATRDFQHHMALVIQQIYKILDTYTPTSTAELQYTTALKRNAVKIVVMCGLVQTYRELVQGLEITRDAVPMMTVMLSDRRDMVDLFYKECDYGLVRFIHYAITHNKMDNIRYYIKKYGFRFLKGDVYLCGLALKYNVDLFYYFKDNGCCWNNSYTVRALMEREDPLLTASLIRAGLDCPCNIYTANT